MSATGGAAPPEKFHQLIEFSILASQTNPFDPMEKALKELGERLSRLDRASAQ